MQVIHKICALLTMLRWWKWAVGKLMLLREVIMMDVNGKLEGNRKRLYRVAYAPGAVTSNRGFNFRSEVKAWLKYVFKKSTSKIYHFCVTGSKASTMASLFPDGQLAVYGKLWPHLWSLVMVFPVIYFRDTETYCGELFPVGYLPGIKIWWAFSDWNWLICIQDQGRLEF